VSDRNPRWKAFIDEHNAQIFHKTWKENYFADSFSRQAIHVLEKDPQSYRATIHSEISLTYTIETSDKPVNCFRNQIMIEEGTADLDWIYIIFGNKSRPIILFQNKETLLGRIRDVVKQDVVNVLHC